MLGGVGVDNVTRDFCGICFERIRGGWLFAMRWSARFQEGDGETSRVASSVGMPTSCARCDLVFLFDCRGCVLRGCGWQQDSLEHRVSMIEFSIGIDECDGCAYGGEFYLSTGSNLCGQGCPMGCLYFTRVFLASRRLR